MSISYFSMLNSISISWMYILIVCIRVRNSFFILYKPCNVILMHLVTNLLLRFRKFVATVYFISMSSNGIISITNSNGESVFFRKMSLRVFTSGKTSAVNSPLQFFMASVIKLKTVLGILCIFDSPLSRIAGPYHRSFCSRSWLHFSPRFAHLENVLINVH